MSRCEREINYSGVVLRCIHPAGHDNPGQPAFGVGALHEVECYVCAGQIEDLDWEPGFRCVKHGTREPIDNPQ